MFFAHMQLDPCDSQRTDRFRERRKILTYRTLALLSLLTPLACYEMHVKPTLIVAPRDSIACDKIAVRELNRFGYDVVTRAFGDYQVFSKDSNINKTMLPEGTASSRAGDLIAFRAERAGGKCVVELVPATYDCMPAIDVESRQCEWSTGGTERTQNEVKRIAAEIEARIREL